MTGTSLDGMDAALVRFTGPTHAELLAFTSSPYGVADRQALEAAVNGASTRELAYLHARLGRLAVEACQGVLERAHLSARDLDFVAAPGQTVWHEPPVVTWQLGDPPAVGHRD